MIQRNTNERARSVPDKHKILTRGNNAYSPVWVFLLGGLKYGLPINPILFFKFTHIKKMKEARKQEILELVGDHVENVIHGKMSQFVKQDKLKKEVKEQLDERLEEDK